MIAKTCPFCDALPYNTDDQIYYIAHAKNCFCNESFFDEDYLIKWNTRHYDQKLKIQQDIIDLLIKQNSDLKKENHSFNMVTPALYATLKYLRGIQSMCSETTYVTKLADEIEKFIKLKNYKE